MPESGENPKPSFDPRPPGERRRAGARRGESSGGDRRTSNGLRVAPGSHGFFGRLTGRSEMDKAKIKRYDPYKFESNSTQLKWVVVLLIAWTVVAITLAFQDRSTASLLVDIQGQGITTSPPAILAPQAMIDFATREGLVCATDEGGFIATPECTHLFDVQRDYESVKGTGSFLTVALAGLLLASIFAFGSFTHRASRNLLTLKSAGQGFSPEKSVMWFFIPVFNLVKPWAVFKELFRASDPSVSTDEPRAWHKKGKVPARVHIWAAIFVVVFIYNPRTIGLFWYSVRETLDDVILAHQRLVIADILLAVLGIAAIYVVIALHGTQEARYKKVGEITVTPPLPVDPLEEALKDGIRRKDSENRRARSKRGRGEQNDKGKG
jgi:hypothetical protein